MNKKGMSGLLIVGIIISIIVVLIFGVILAYVFSNQPEKTQPENNMTIYIKAIDSKTNTQLPANYVILDSKSHLVSQGILVDDALTPVKVTGNSVKVYCYNSNHYTNEVDKKFTQYELKQNSSQITCPMDKVGDLQITYKGNLSTNNLKVTVKSSNFRYLSGVMTWTANIISADVKTQISCNNWTQYSYINGTENTPLAKNYYMCQNKLYECSSVNDKCTLTTEVPKRFNNYNVFTTGQDVKGNYTFDINTKTGNLNNDCLTLILYDQDLRWVNGAFEYVSEQNGQIGAKDYPIKFCA